MEKKIVWASLPLQEASLKMSMYYDMDLAYALKKNLTDRFFEHLKMIANSKQNLIISSFGLPGSGKSYQVIRIAEKLLQYKGKELNIDNCCFTITDMLKRIQEVDKGEVLILDEQLHTHGYGSLIEKNAMDNIERVVRAHGLCLFFLAPVFMKHNYFYLLETWQMGTLGKWDWSKNFQEQWMFTKSIVYDSKNRPLGYIVTDKPKNEKFLAEYERKKDKFIDEVRKKRASGRHEYLEERARKLIENEEFVRLFREAKTKRLKKLHTIYFLQGELLSVEELNMLVDYIEYFLLKDLENKREKLHKILNKKV